MSGLSTTRSRARQRASWKVRSLAALALLSVTACYENSTGQDPDDQRLYTPNGITTSASGRYLFVVNSNFDLRYNSGTLLALDLVSMAKKALECRTILRASPCVPEGAVDRDGVACLAKRKAAGCEGGDNTPSFAVASVRIGAFAGDVTATLRRDATGAAVPDAGRLLIPVRGDATLVLVDYEESASGVTLRCAPGTQPAFGQICAPAWRIGSDTTANTRGLKLEAYGYFVATPSAWPTDPQAPMNQVGGVAAVVHQVSGHVSAFVGIARDDGLHAPSAKLAYTLADMPASGSGIAALDLPVASGGDFVPRFLVANLSQPSLYHVQFSADVPPGDTDASSTPQLDRGYLSVTGTSPINTLSGGNDVRGIVVDPPEDGEQRPTRVFLTSRSPASMVIGNYDASRNRIDFYDSLPMPLGPSRIVRSRVGGHTRILATSFDTRSLFIYDADQRRVGNVIRTQAGPNSVTTAEVPVTDASGVVHKHPFAIVANFSDSTLQLVDLDDSDPTTNEQVVFSVGVPSAPTR